MCSRTRLWPVRWKEQNTNFFFSPFTFAKPWIGPTPTHRHACRDRFDAEDACRLEAQLRRKRQVYSSLPCSACRMDFDSSVLTIKLYATYFAALIDSCRGCVQYPVLHGCQSLSGLLTGTIEKRADLRCRLMPLMFSLAPRSHRATPSSPISFLWPAMSWATNPYSGDHEIKTFFFFIRQDMS